MTYECLHVGDAFLIELSFKSKNRAGEKGCTKIAILQVVT